MTMLHLRSCEGIDRARKLRSNLTRAERLFWYYVRARRFRKWKFRRQVPLGDYVVDFICAEARLVIEIDGGQHMANASDDARRTGWLNANGYRVIRFWNNDVLGNIDGVMEEVEKNLRPSPRPSP